MPVNVVVGGQYGSEGKGKITAFLAERHGASIVVRCGGPNSGHTVRMGGKLHTLRHIPAGFHVPGCRLLISSGSYLDVAVFLQEIKDLGVDEHRIGVSPNAGIIEPRHIEQESQLFLQERIGSTLSGTGAAVSDRVLRGPQFRHAKDIPELRRFLADIPAEINDAANGDRIVIIEGTQGFGLSLLHSPYFPKATSRDTSASACCSEVGISPRLITDITLVFRTFPIRVAGDSGPLENELSWEAVTERSGAPRPIREHTSVTSKLRRVAEFDLKIARMAIRHNLPTIVALNHIDYINWNDHAKSSYEELSATSRSFIAKLETALDIRFSTIGTGSDHHHVIENTDVYRGKKTGLLAASA